MCGICDEFDKERERLIQIAMDNIVPCIVCGSEAVTAIGTWVPGKNRRLAAGGNEKKVPVFAYWLCDAHADGSEETHKVIERSIIRGIRTGDL